MKTTQSKDGTVKFEFPQGYSAVIIPMNTKTKEGKDREKTYTLCLSTQVGCSMNCQFCYSAKTKFKKNLSLDELKEQINVAAEHLKISPGEFQSIVFMGMGEPLLNLENVLEFCKHMNEKHYLSYSKMTISTSGIIPKMKDITNFKFPVKLALSLHSPSQEIRDKIMPGLKQFPIKDLIKVCHEYNDRISND